MSMSTPTPALIEALPRVSARSVLPSGGGRSNNTDLKPLPFLRPEVDDELDLRQLRHHTKNALQRILGLIAQAPGLHNTPEGERIALELEQRIHLSAAVSNALFGLTRAPGSMTDRLRSLGGSIIDLLRDPSQTIQLDVLVRGQCPPHLREAVLRVAHELIGNAVKHGMRGRRTGRIAIQLDSDQSRRTRLSVIDDGRGFASPPRGGEGLSLAQGLAEQHNGTLRLRREAETIATLELPHDDL
jgi:two-component sensor histidine kinase